MTTSSELPPVDEMEPKSEEPPLPETIHLARELPLDLQARDDDDMIPATVMLSPTEGSGQRSESAPVFGTEEIDHNAEKSKTYKKKIKDQAENDFVLETVFLSSNEAEDEDNTNE